METSSLTLILVAFGCMKYIVVCSTIKHRNKANIPRKKHNHSNLALKKTKIRFKLCHLLGKSKTNFYCKSFIPSGL